MRQHHSSKKFSDFVSLLTTCCLITFSCYLALTMRLPVLPIYARTFGITTSQIGIINAIFYMMAGLLSLPSGFLSEKLGIKRLAAFGLVALAISSFLLYFSRSFSQLVLLSLVLGAGVAAFGPTMMSFVARIAPSTHLGRAYGWYTTALFCGLSLGPGVGGVLGQRIGLAPVFLISSVCTLITLSAVIVFLPKTRSTKDVSQKNQSTLIATISALFRNQPLLGCWLITFGANLVGGMFFSFLPLHALDQQLSVAQTGIIFLVQAMVNATSRIPFGTLSDRVNHRKYLVAAGIACVGLSISGMGAAALFYQFILAGIGMGMGMGLAFTSIGALIAETVAENQRGAAMGGYNACIYFGMMAGSILFGPVIEAIGFNRGFSLSGAILIAFGILFMVLMHGFLPPPKTQAVKT